MSDFKVSESRYSLTAPHKHTYMDAEGNEHTYLQTPYTPSSEVIELKKKVKKAEVYGEPGPLREAQIKVITKVMLEYDMPGIMEYIEELAADCLLDCLFDYTEEFLKVMVHEEGWTPIPEMDLDRMVSGLDTDEKFSFLMEVVERVTGGLGKEKKMSEVLRDYNM